MAQFRVGRIDGQGGRATVSDVHTVDAVSAFEAAKQRWIWEQIKAERHKFTPALKHGTGRDFAVVGDIQALEV